MIRIAILDVERDGRRNAYARTDDNRFRHVNLGEFVVAVAHKPPRFPRGKPPVILVDARRFRVDEGAHVVGAFLKTDNPRIRRQGVCRGDAAHVVNIPFGHGIAREIGGLERLHADLAVLRDDIRAIIAHREIDLAKVHAVRHDIHEEGGRVGRIARHLLVVFRIELRIVDFEFPLVVLAVFEDARAVRQESPRIERRTPRVGMALEFGIVHARRHRLIVRVPYQRLAVVRVDPRAERGVSVETVRLKPPLEHRLRRLHVARGQDDRLRQLVAVSAVEVARNENGHHVVRGKLRLHEILVAHHHAVPHARHLECGQIAFRGNVLREALPVEIERVLQNVRLRNVLFGGLRDHLVEHRPLFLTIKPPAVDRGAHHADALLFAARGRTLFESVVRRRDVGVLLAVDDIAVVGAAVVADDFEAREHGARNRQHDRERRRVPADLDVLHAAVRFARRVFAVAIEVVERDERVPPFLDVTERVVLRAALVGRTQIIGRLAAFQERRGLPIDTEVRLGKVVGGHISIRIFLALWPSSGKIRNKIGDFLYLREVDNRLAGVVVDRTDNGFRHIRRESRSRATDEVARLLAGGVDAVVNHNRPLRIVRIHQNRVFLDITAVATPHLQPQVFRADRDRTRIDLARRQTECPRHARIVAQILGVHNQIGAVAADCPLRVGDGHEVGIAERLDDERMILHVLLSVIDESRLDRRHRVFRHAFAVDIAHRDDFGVGAREELGIVRPAVAVLVLVRIIGVAGGEFCRIAILPHVGNTVVVGEDLAHVHLTETIEVVAHVRIDAARDRRIEGQPEVEDLREQVFHVVGKPVPVIIGIGVARETVEILPPIDKSVAVGVRGLDVAIVDRAARLHALGEVAQISLPGRDLFAVVVYLAVPGQTGRAAAIDFLPPIRETVRVGIDARIFPGSGGPETVPHLDTRFRERPAARHQVARRREATADFVHVAVRHILDQLAVRQLLRQQIELEKTHGAVDRTHVAPAVRVRRIAEAVRRHARLAREHGIAAQVLRVDEGVGRAAVQRRQMADRVRNPRRDVPARINAVPAVGGRRQPTDPPHARGARRRVDLADHVCGEAHGFRDHVRCLDRGRQGREAVMLHEFRRERLAPVVVVAAGVGRCAEQMGVDLLAVRGHFVVRERFLAVILDFLGRTGAVPHAHFIHPALETFRHSRIRQIRRIRRGTRADGEDGGVHRIPAGPGQIRILHVLVHAGRRNQRRVRMPRKFTVDVKRQSLACVGQREMRPFALFEHLGAFDALAACRFARSRGDRVGVVEKAIRSAVLDADAEVRTDGGVLPVQIARRIQRAPVDDRLVGGRLGTHPRLDRELLEQVRGGRAARTLPVGPRIRAVAVQIERLAAVGIRKIERVRRLAHGARQFDRVVFPVAVGVVSLVRLERHDEPDAGFRRGRQRRVVVALVYLAACRQRPERQDRHVVRNPIIQRGVAVRARPVREPGGRGIRVIVVRRSQVGQRLFLVVAQSVAVGIRLRQTHHPREADRIQELAQRRIGAARENRRQGPGVDGRRQRGFPSGIRGADDVHCIAQDRVQAVVEFPIVVHAVLVRVRHARIGRYVALLAGQRIECGLVAGLAVDRRRQHDVAGRRVPRAQGRRQIAKGAPHFFRQAEVGRLRGIKSRRQSLAFFRERFAPVLHRNVEARLFCRGYPKPFHAHFAGHTLQHAAHERRHVVVIAEVAHLLHEVFLAVRETVVVEVQVAHAAKPVVLGARLRIAGPRRVHARRDIDRVRDDGVRSRHHETVRAQLGELGGDFAGRVGQLELLDDRVERQPGVLALPAVRQAVAVGVHRARVHAAAADAARTVVDRLAVNGAECHARMGLPFIGEVGNPRAALFAVRNAVAVRVGIGRVGREELVVPTLLDARMVRVDRFARPVRVARIGARVFLGQRQPVLVLGQPRIRLAARVGPHIQHPPVRHAVAARIRAVQAQQLLADRDIRAVESLLVVCDQFRRSRRVGVGDDIRRQHDRRTRRPLGKALELALHVLCDLLRFRYGLHVAAIPPQEILVVVGVGNRVDGLARIVRRVFPTVGDKAVAVRPRGARIETERLVDLAVDEDKLVRAGNLLESALIDDRLDGYVRAPARCRFFHHLPRPDARFDIRVGRTPVEVGRGAIRLELGLHHQHVVDGVGRFIDETVVRLDEIEAILLEILAILCAEEGHVVAIRVFLAVVHESVRAHQDFPAVGHMVAIRIPMARIRPERELLEIGKAIAVEIARPAARGDRIEVLQDVRAGNRRPLDNVVGVEAFEDERLPRARHAEGRQLRIALQGVRIDRRRILRGRRPDLGLVPEEILPSVREVVLVRVGERQIHARGRFRRPDREIVAVRLRPLVGVVRKTVCGRPRAPFGRLELVLVERRLVRMLFAPAEICLAVGVFRVVQTFMEAAQLHPRRELVGAAHVARRIIAPVFGPLRVSHRQIVAVDPVARERLEIGRSVRERLARLPLAHGVDIGDAVLVDVAEIVFRAVFLREDRLVLRLEIALLVVRHFRRERDGNGRHAFLRLRRDQRGRCLRILPAVAAARLDRNRQPAVEERILLRVGISVVARSRGGHAANRADRAVQTIVQPAIVDRADLVAERVGVACRIGTAVPFEAERRRTRKRGPRIDVTFAAADRARVLCRVLIVRRCARRTARDERQELGRGNRILVGHRHRRRGVAVLVLDRDRHRAVALRRTEIGHELPRGRLRHIPRPSIVAARDRDAHARLRPVRGRRAEVGVHVAPDRPGDRIAAGETARNLPGVRIGFRRLERAARRHVLDIDALRLGLGVVVVCRLAARRERCRGRHLRVDHESVHRGHHRTVHFADGEFHRRGARQTDLNRRRPRGVVVAVRARDDVVVRGIDLQKTGVDFKFRHGRLGRDLHLDFQRIDLLFVPVAETDFDLAAAFGFIVGLRRRLDFHNRVVQDLDLHRIVRLRPVVHVLVLHLGYDLPRAGLVERIFERFRRRVRISVDDLWIPDDNVIAPRRPFRLELVVFRRLVGVRQVVGSFVLDNRLESARHAFRDAVGILVAAAFGCNAIHFKARDGRLDVEDAEPGFV